MEICLFDPEMETVQHAYRKILISPVLYPFSSAGVRQLVPGERGKEDQDGSMARGDLRRSHIRQGNRGEFQ